MFTLIYGQTYAHQGGWDEVLLIAGPLVLFLAVVVVAACRLKKMQPAEPAPDDLAPDDLAPDDPAHDQPTSDQPIAEEASR